MTDSAPNYTVIYLAGYLGILSVLLIALLLWQWPDQADVPTDRRVSTDSLVVLKGTLQPDSTFALTAIARPSQDTTEAITDPIAFDSATGVPESVSLNKNVILKAADTEVAGTKLLWLILIVGALGACLHALTSLSEYVGNKSFEKSWTMWYLMRPFVGGILALLFFFVIRGGFTDQIEADGLYGVIAIAGLIGLFSKQALYKLSDIFDVLFQSGKEDNLKDKLASIKPIIETLEPASIASGSTNVVLKVTGHKFVQESKVMVDGQERPTIVGSATQLSVTLPDTDMVQAGTLKVTVVNPDDKGGASDAKGLTVT